ncbi:MAG TPA: hypothetical protein VET65_07140 [Candidatus Limnocylindrales bacterium]|nr:hypothetical protein [Candidatus Limnocylindrales bacterium]
MATPSPGEPPSDRLRSAIREGFTIALGAASWAFDEADRLLDRWMAQGQLSREEGRRRFDEFRDRTRAGVRQATSGMPIATREQVQSLERRIEELTRQVEALRAQRSEVGQRGDVPPGRPRLS